MKLTHEDHDQFSIFRIRGDLTDDYCDQLRTTVSQRMQNDVRDFVLDLEHLEFIDSQGLEALLWLQETCQEKLGQVRLAAPNENFQKILELTRLTNQFELHRDVESAVRSLGV